MASSQRFAFSRGLSSLVSAATWVMVDDVVNWTVLLTTTCAQSVSFPPCCGAKYFISKCNNVCGGVSCFSVCQWRLPRHDAFLLYSLVYLFCYSISAVTVFHQFLLHYNNFTAIAILCGFFIIFTAQCTLVQMRGLGIACRLSVRPSVTLVICDHIGWKSWKRIAQTISPTPSLFAAKRRST